MKATEPKLTLLYIMLLLVVCSCSKHGDDEIFVPAKSMQTSLEISNQNVTAFAEDTLGYVWIGTERGLNRYDSRSYRQYFHNDDDAASIPSNSIKSLSCDSKGRLWVGTAEGVCHFTDKGDFRTVKFPHQSPSVHQVIENKEGRIFFNTVEQLYEWMPDGDSARLVIPDFDPTRRYVNDCFVGPDGDLWSAIGGQVLRYDGRTLKLKKTYPTGVKPHFSYLINKGILWVLGERTVGIDTKTGQRAALPQALQSEEQRLGSNGSVMFESGSTSFISTKDGFCLYDQATNKMVRQGQKSFPFEAPEGIVTGIFVDSRNNVWIALRDQGFVIRYNFKERFNSDVHLTAALRGHSISSLTKDRQGRLWLMDLSNNLFSYDETTGTIVDYGSIAGLAMPLLSEIASSILMDRSDRLWITNHEQLYEARVANGRCGIVRKHDLPNKAVSLFEDANGTIWIGTLSNNLYRLQQGQHDFQPLPVAAPKMTMAIDLAPLSGNRMLAGMLLSGLYEVNTLTGKARKLGKQPSLGYSQIYEDCSHNLWIGTMTQGLYLQKAGESAPKKLDDAEQQGIMAIVQDAAGDVWVSTDNGLDCILDKTLRVIRYTAADGIGGNQFNRGAVAKLNSGKLAFGGTHGVTIFDPTVSVPKRDIPLHFSDLQLGNRSVKAGGRIISKTMELAPKVTLRHNQNNFTVGVTALDYREHEQAHFFYKLEGYEREEHDLGTQRQINLVNIPHGHYRLHVWMRNNDNSVINAETILPIIVKPVWWQTWWAKLFFLLLFAAVAYQLWRVRQRMLAGRRETERLEREKAQEKKVNEMNMRFFTNISHEFRTPLTMIASPVTELEESEEDLSAKGKRLLGVVKYNVSRMLRLVNQVLDLGKLDNDAIRLQVTSLDLAGMLRNLIEGYDYNARQKDIALRIEGMDEAVDGLFDADKLDKIVANLMSNALKYTPKGGEIACRLQQSDGKAVLTIADNGPSIPEAQLTKIFERYYQVNPNQGFGTGIGLYYVSRLVRLHHGDIHAENLPEGGVAFIVELPLTDDYTEAEHAAETASQQQLYPVAKAEEQSAETDSHDRTLLVIDDDTSIVEYLRLLFADTYNILSEYDARSGFATLKEKQPDLVICDVAMPGDDGFAFCQWVKTDLETSHIPVILVTARTTKENQLQGLRTGADAYVTKPFDPDYLKALVQSQLANRDRIRQQLGSVTKAEDVEPEALAPQDESFMTELYAIMEKEISNAELNVEVIAEMMKLSRTKFYYKVKGLTGESPKAFFRKYKLNRAAELLLEGKMNVSEIAYYTGFASLTVFSRNFKQQFGVTPREYRG